MRCQKKSMSILPVAAVSVQALAVIVHTHWKRYTITASKLLLHTMAFLIFAACMEQRMKCGLRTGKKAVRIGTKKMQLHNDPTARVRAILLINGMSRS